MRLKIWLFLILLITFFLYSIANAEWKFVTPMPYARFGHDATLGSDNKIYVMGGFVFYRHDGMFSNIAYDIEKDTWEILEPVPGYMSEDRYKVLEKETKIWRTVRKRRGQKGKYEIWAPVNGKNKWTPLKDPIPVENMRKTGVERQGDGVAIVTGIDGKIHWIGGKAQSPSGPGENLVLTYNPFKKLWTTDVKFRRVYISDTTYGGANDYITDIPPMQEHRIDHEAVVTSDGKIFVMGGRRNKLKMDPYVKRMIRTNVKEVTNSVECYDPKKGKWEYRKPMTKERFLFAAVIGNDGRIYTFGGSGDFAPDNSWELFNSTEVYDPKMDAWSTLKSMPETRNAMAGVLGADGKIYIIGGVNKYRGSPLKTVFIYDPKTDTWEKGPPMNLPRHTLAAVATPDGKIYAIGGSDAGAYENRRSINIFLPKKQELYTGKVQDTVEVLDIFE